MQVCGSAITPSDLPHPLHGPCDLHFITRAAQDTTPSTEYVHRIPQNTSPGDIIFKSTMSSPGCVILCGTRCTVVQIALTVSLVDEYYKNEDTL